MRARSSFGLPSHVIPVLVAGLLVGGTGVAMAQDAGAGPLTDAKIVYVRVQDVVQSTPGAAAAQSTFEQELVVYRQELQDKTAAIDSMVSDYQRQEVMLSPQAKSEKQQEILDKQQELQNRTTELNAQAEQRQQELLQPILERVTAVIEEVRAENGYHMVIDAGAAGIVTADTRLDITDTVNQRIQAAGAGSTGE